MMISQIQDQYLMSCSHNIAKSSLGFSQEIGFTHRIWIENFDSHGLSLLKEILSSKPTIPVRIEGIVLLFSGSKEFHFSVEIGLEEDFEDGIGLGKDIWVFEVSSVEAKLDFERVWVCLRRLH